MIGRAVFAAILLVGAVQPGRADELGDLIERTRSAKALHATYSLKFKLKAGSTATPPPDGEIRIDFQAPDRLRIENRMGAQTMRMWCVGERVTTHVVSGAAQGAMFGAVDLRPLRSELASVEEALADAFPEAPKA